MKNRSKERNSTLEGPSRPRTSGPRKYEGSQSEIEDEHSIRKQARPVRRKYNIFRQTRPRGTNPERAVALVCHFGVVMDSKGLIV